MRLRNYILMIHPTEKICMAQNSNAFFPLPVQRSLSCAPTLGAEFVGDMVRHRKDGHTAPSPASVQSTAFSHPQTQTPTPTSESSQAIIAPEFADLVTFVVQDRFLAALTTYQHLSNLARKNRARDNLSPAPSPALRAPHPTLKILLLPSSVSSHRGGSTSARIFRGFRGL
jgi:hypothetical protein